MELNEMNKQAQKQWNNTPCGTGDFLNALDEDSLEYFEKIRHNRYNVSDKWMKKVIDFSIGQNKKLLEVGFGVGSDLLTFCENGAEVYGVDITEKHYELTKRNFELHNKKCTLILSNANNLPFNNECFDVVYSFGVLHHIPEIDKCIDEIYRVLKPGGMFIMGVYYKYSAFHLLYKIIYRGILRGKLLTLGYDGLMATIERGADGINIKPLVKTYSKCEVRKLLSKFDNVNLTVAHLDNFPKYAKFFGGWEWLLQTLETRIGWYVVAYARK